MTVNKVILVGNLGRDPETRTTQAGDTVATLSVATSHRSKDRGGEWTDATEWHRVSVFGRAAESAARYLTKGRQVYVEGRAQSRKWTDREGRERYTTEVVAHTVRFLGGGGGDGGGGGGGDGGGGDQRARQGRRVASSPGRADPPTSHRTPPYSRADCPPDDDIPF